MGMMDEQEALIGRVTRCSTRGFVGAVRIPEPEVPAFGDFCLAEAQQGRSRVIGVIYDISIQDDELARQMAMAENLSPEQLADTQQRRLVPVEYAALAVGYHNDGGYHYALPPQPPLTLAPIYPMSGQEVRDFTERLDFLPLILGAPHIPVDDLLAAALRTAAATRAEEVRRPYLVRAGRACARLLGRDLARFETFLQTLRS